MHRLLASDEALLGSPTEEVLASLRLRLDPERSAPHRLLSAHPGLDEGEGILALVDGTRWEVHTAPIRSDEVSGRIWSFHLFVLALEEVAPCMFQVAIS